MAVQKVSLNFHQTFKPEAPYIAAILELAGTDTYLSAKEISSLTGIPMGESSGKVEPHIEYATFMGLISYEKKDGKYQLKKTSLGEVVFLEDPGLNEKLTILLCHCMMLRDTAGAPLWVNIEKKILPRYRGEISKEMLMKELETSFEGKASTKNIAPFFGSYDSFFNCLELIFSSTDSVRIESTPYESEFIYLYAVTLLAYWNEKYREQDEISSTQMDALEFGCVFGWDKQMEYKVLEYLADKEIIRMNRQLMPYTILKLIELDDAIELLYSELC